MNSVPITFSILRRDADEPSGFELGHLTVEGPGGTATSIGRSPDQAMMIYLAVANLMDTIADVAQSRRGAWHEFVGADSSFMVVVEKGEGDSLVIRQKGTTIAQGAFRLVAQRLLHEVDRFWRASPLGPGDSVHDDFVNARARLVAVAAG